MNFQRHLIAPVHELFIAKLNSWFTLPDLKLVHDYLPDRKQRTRVNASYSILLDVYSIYYILFGVPESIYLVYCYLTYFGGSIFHFK